MDVDANELLLVSQFNSMLTTDKDSLVTELHTFLNFEITEQECKFYLEMTNWFVFNYYITFQLLTVYF